MGQTSGLKVEEPIGGAEASPESKVQNPIVGRCESRVGVENVTGEGDPWSEQKFPLWGAGDPGSGWKFSRCRRRQIRGKAPLQGGSLCGRCKSPRWRRKGIAAQGGRCVPQWEEEPRVTGE